MNHEEVAERNRIAWTADAYRAWVVRHGTPDRAAARVASDPRHVLRRLLPFVGDPDGAAVANPLGSHGRVATALALLGARVTVFDASEPNARYARELAAAAGVSLDYVVGDFQATAPERAGRFDAVVMELGIVHYFCALERFVLATRTLLGSGGRFVLTDFHPLAKKSFDLESGAPILRGDYFATAPEEADVPYGAFVEGDLPRCLIRRWNLGEIVTAFASGGFRIEALVEHPSGAFARLPGTFTLTGTAE